MTQFATGGIPVADTPREQTEMQSRHRERGIQVHRHPKALDGAVAISLVLAAKREHIMRARIQLVDQEQP